MKKIVINVSDHGYFDLSEKAIKRYKELTNNYKRFYRWQIKRDDPVLVRVVEELGTKSYDYGTELKVIEIPDDIEWEVVFDCRNEYCESCAGKETIHEKHRVWS